MNNFMSGILSSVAILGLIGETSHAQAPKAPPAPALIITCGGTALCTQQGNTTTVTVPPSTSGYTVSGQSDVLTAQRCWDYTNYTSTKPVTATIPSNLPSPCDIALWQVGAGSISPIAGSGVTMMPTPYGWTRSAGQGAILLIHFAKVGNTPTFVMTGGGAP